MVKWTERPGNLLKFDFGSCKNNDKHSIACVVLASGLVNTKNR